MGLGFFSPKVKGFRSSFFQYGWNSVLFSLVLKMHAFKLEHYLRQNFKQFKWENRKGNFNEQCCAPISLVHIFQIFSINWWYLGELWNCEKLAHLMSCFSGCFVVVNLLLLLLSFGPQCYMCDFSPPAPSLPDFSIDISVTLFAFVFALNGVSVLFAQL